MHGLQACLFKYISVAAFFIYTQCGEEMKMLLNLQRLEAMHFKIVMKSTLLIVENHGKIMELCFWISVGTLRPACASVWSAPLLFATFKV